MSLPERGRAVGRAGGWAIFKRRTTTVPVSRHSMIRRLVLRQGPEDNFEQSLQHRVGYGMRFVTIAASLQTCAHCFNDTSRRSTTLQEIQKRPPLPCIACNGFHSAPGNQVFRNRIKSDPDQL